MRVPKTLTLLLLSFCLFVGTTVLIRPVVVLQPVRTDAGEIVRRPDGRPLMRRDALGQFRANWDAYSCMFGGFVLFAWALARAGRVWYIRHRTHEIQSETPTVS